MSARRIFLAAVAAALLAFGAPAFAQTGPASPPAAVQTGTSVSGAMKAIRDAQKVSHDTRINPDKVSESLLARLGAAVMNRWLPNQRQRRWLDDMLGGPGSNGLQDLRMIIGYNYLTRGIEGRHGHPGYGGWGMTGPGGRYGTHGPGFGLPGPYGRGYGMMGRWGWYAPWIIPAAIGGALVVLIVILIIVAALRRRSGVGTRLDFLKTRLARGDITKDEFDKLREDVK